MPGKFINLVGAKCVLVKTKAKKHAGVGHRTSFQIVRASGGKPLEFWADNKALGHAWFSRIQGAIRSNGQTNDTKGTQGAAPVTSTSCPAVDFIQKQTVRVASPQSESKESAEAAVKTQAARSPRLVISTKRSSRDMAWNTAFQAAADGSADAGASVAELRNLETVFILEAGRTARTIIEEMIYPVKFKSIAPTTSPQSSHTAREFVHGGIRYTVLAPGDAARAKAITREFQGAAAYASASQGQIRLKPACIVQYLGHRVVATAEGTPGERAIQAYGKTPSGEFLSDPDANGALRQAGAMLNLRPHRLRTHVVGCDAATRPLIHASSLIKVFRGSETKTGQSVSGDTSRLYLRNARYAFPPDLSQAQTDSNLPWVLFRLRPELVRDFHASLCPDAGIGYESDSECDSESDISDDLVSDQEHKHEQEDLQVVEASMFLHEVAIPRLVQKLDTALVHRIPMSGDALCQRMHDAGVNLRYLGRVATITKRKYIRDMARVEMFSRAGSAVLGLRLARAIERTTEVCEKATGAGKDKQQIQDVQMEHCGLRAKVNQLVAEFFNEALGRAEKSAALYREITPKVKRKFNFSLNSSPGLGIPALWLTDTLQLRSRVVLRDSDELRSRIRDSKCATPVREADVAAILPRIKVPRIVSSTLSRLEASAEEGLSEGRWADAEKDLAVLLRRQPDPKFAGFEALSPLKSLGSGGARSKPSGDAKRGGKRRRHRRGLTQTIAPDRLFNRSRTLRKGEIKWVTRAVLEKCIGFLMVRGATTEGLFRTAGAHTRIESLYSQLQDLENGHNLSEKQLCDIVDVTLSDHEAEEVASVVKKILRETEDTLLTAALYSKFEAIRTVEDAKAAVADLPANNRAVLRALMRIVALICGNPETRMTVKACAIVIGINLAPRNQPPMAPPKLFRAFDVLVTNLNEVFGADNEEQKSNSSAQHTQNVPETFFGQTASGSAATRLCSAEIWLPRVRILNKIAECRIRQGDFHGCLSAASDALVAARLPWHLERARSFMLKSRAFFGLGISPEIKNNDPQLFESYQKSALGMYSKAQKLAMGYCLGAVGHPFLVSIYATFGGLYARASDYDWASRCLSAAVSTAQQLCGADHPEVARQNRNFAQYLRECAMALGLGQENRKMELLNSAEMRLETALKVAQETFGMKSLSVANILYQKAETLSDMGYGREAARTAFACLLIREDRLLPGAPALVESLVQMGMVAKRTGDWAVAIKYLQRALSLHGGRPVFDRSWVRRVTRALAVASLCSQPYRAEVCALAEAASSVDIKDRALVKKVVAMQVCPSPHQEISKAVKRFAESARQSGISLRNAALGQNARVLTALVRMVRLDVTALSQLDNSINMRGVSMDCNWTMARCVLGSDGKGGLDLVVAESPEPAKADESAKVEPEESKLPKESPEPTEAESAEVEPEDSKLPKESDAQGPIEQQPQEMPAVTENPVSIEPQLKQPSVVEISGNSDIKSIPQSPIDSAPQDSTKPEQDHASVEPSSGATAPTLEMGDKTIGGSNATPSDEKEAVKDREVGAKDNAQKDRSTNQKVQVEKVDVVCSKSSNARQADDKQAGESLEPPNFQKELKSALSQRKDRRSILLKKVGYSTLERDEIKAVSLLQDNESGGEPTKFRKELLKEKFRLERKGASPKTAARRAARVVTSPKKKLRSGVGSPKPKTQPRSRLRVPQMKASRGRSVSRERATPRKSSKTPRKGFESSTPRGGRKSATTPRHKSKAAEGKCRVVKHEGKMGQKSHKSRLPRGADRQSKGRSSRVRPSRTSRLTTDTKQRHGRTKPKTNVRLGINKPRVKPGLKKNSRSDAKAKQTAAKHQSAAKPNQISTPCRPEADAKVLSPPAATPACAGKGDPDSDAELPGPKRMSFGTFFQLLGKNLSQATLNPEPENSDPEDSEAKNGPTDGAPLGAQENNTPRVPFATPVNTPARPALATPEDDHGGDEDVSRSGMLCTIGIADPKQMGYGSDLETKLKQLDPRWTPTRRAANLIEATFTESQLRYLGEQSCVVFMDYEEGDKENSFVIRSPNTA